MPFFALTILIQILCVVHVIKTGKNNMWMTAIIFLPLAGSAAYFLLEILPDLRGNRHMRYAKKKAVQKIDPEREIRIAKENLELTDSLANRLELADSLAANNRYDEAVDHYRDIVGEPHGQDDRTLFKYARCLFETGQARKALDIIKPIEPVAVSSENGQRQVLKARIMAELGQHDEAHKTYASVVDKVSGIEARGHFAALLLEMGDELEAREQLEEICQNAKRMTVAQLDEERPVYEWASKILKTL